MTRINREIFTIDKTCLDTRFELWVDSDLMQPPEWAVDGSLPRALAPGSLNRSFKAEKLWTILLCLRVDQRFWWFPINHRDGFLACVTEWSFSDTQLP